jgi:hypothetical protein
VWETGVVDQFRGNAGIRNTDNVGVVVRVLAESEGGALELSLHAREYLFHRGGRGDGERVIPFGVVGSVKWRDRGREIGVVRG